MVYVVAAVALAIVLALLMRRRDPRVATIRSLPVYGTPEATALQSAVANQGPARLVTTGEEASSWMAIEPARSPAHFRDQMSRGGGRPSSPAARWRHSRTKPVRPKSLTAPRTRPGFAPPQMLLVLADRCRICRRPLTNTESRRRGVGPDCYRNYGARVVHAANPDFAVWSDRKNLMEAQRAAWQALLDELYRHLMERFETEMRNWDEAGHRTA